MSDTKNENQQRLRYGAAMSEAFDIIKAVEDERDSLKESAENMSNPSDWREFAHWSQIVLDSLAIRLRRQVNVKPSPSSACSADEEWLDHPLTVKLMEQEKERAGRLLRSQGIVRRMQSLLSCLLHRHPKDPAVIAEKAEMEEILELIRQNDQGQVTAPESDEI